MKVFNIRDFGAVPDGTLQTSAIQAAIDQCADAGGTVVVPPGTFVSGRLNLVSNMTLKLEEGAVLAGSLDWRDYSLVPDDDGVWKGFKHRTSFLRGVGLENVCIEGPGVIDGRDCRNPGGEEGFRGPHATYFLNCRNLLLKGYVIRNSANWAHCVEKTSAVRWESVSVEAGHDGCHLRGCTDVVIDRCSFHTGDDSIAGFDNTNMKVLNTTLNSSCSAFRFGGRGLLVENCRFYGPGKYIHRISKRTNMLCAFTYFSVRRDKPIVSGDWTIRNCTMDNVDRLCSLVVSGHAWQTGAPLEDVRFEQCTVTDMRECCWGDSNETPALALAFRHCKVAFAEGRNTPFLRLRNFRSCRLEDVSVTGLQGANLLECDGSGTVSLENVLCDGVCAAAPLGMEVAPHF